MVFALGPHGPGGRLSGPATPVVKWGAGSRQPGWPLGGFRTFCPLGPPFGLKFGSRFMLDRHSLLFISGACVLPVFYLTGFFVCFIVN